MQIKEIRNPKWINEEQTLIECEVNLIKDDGTETDFQPYGASKDDVVELSQEIFAQASQMTDIQPYIVPPVDVPQVVSRRQFALALFQGNKITGDEAIAMTALGTPPKSISDAINTLSDNDKIIALVNFAATTYERSSPMLTNLSAILGMSSTDVDNLFILAATF
jgi:hypothetical protein